MNRKEKRSPHITGRRPDVRGLPIDESVDRELRSHLEMKVEELVEEGMDPEEAWERALSEFGDTDRIRRDCRRVSGLGDLRRRVVLLFPREGWREARGA